MDVLFVCTGNTCRSPMAEAIMRSLVEERDLALSIGSAGLRAESMIASKAVRALQRRSIVVHERAAVQLTEQIVDDASLVLCMTEEQRQTLAEAVPGRAERIFVWGDFVARAAAGSPPTGIRPTGQAADLESAYDVPDPAGQDEAVYEATAATIEALAVATLRVLGAGSA